MRLDVAGDLSARELDAIANGPPGARWVLAEVPFEGVDKCFLDGLSANRRRGFGVLIAHPERAAGLLAGGLALLRPEPAAGSLLQVNVCSLLGRHGDEAREAAGLLVRERFAYVVASVGHPGHREHTLAAAADELPAAGASRLPTRQLTFANPRFLLRHGLPGGEPVRAGAWRHTRAGALERARVARRRLVRPR